MIATLAFFMLQSVPIRISGDDLSDLTFLDAQIGTRRIAELGEATHGGAEFYKLKLRIVRYLHERRGFNILAIESGMLETGLAALRRAELTDREFMTTTVSGGMNWREMLPLFAYIKSRPQLRVIGVDPQFSATEVLDYTHDLLKPYRPKLAAQVRQRLGEPYQFMAKTGDPTEFRTARDDYLRWLKALEGHVGALRWKPEHKAGFAVLTQGLSGLRRYWDYEPTTPVIDRFALRDQIMADHLLAQVGKEKVIVWAHNGHIGNGIGYRVMGDHVRAARDKDVFSLGIFARSGEWREHWSNQTKPWDAAPDGLESRFPKRYDASFLPTSVFTDAVSAYEPENGGRISFVPKDRFDGLVVVDRLSPTNRP
jgi:erythromycin esterase